MRTELKDTTTSEVDKEISRLRGEIGLRTQGRVLTLVIMAEKGHSKNAVQAAISASREHPCRIIVHIAHSVEKPNRLDAEVSIGGDAGASEVIVLRGWGESSHPTESLLSALLLPDAPIVAWWPHALPESPVDHSVGRIATRRITDSAREPDAMRALHRLREVFAPGDTDLAWTRLTQWRIQLTAVLDDLEPSPVRKVIVEGSDRSPSVILLGAWLGHRLGAPVEFSGADQPRGLYRVRLEREDGEVVLYRPGRSVATLSPPGAPEQQIALPVRTLSQCLAEELRRLDPDEAYGEVLMDALTSTPLDWCRTHQEPAADEDHSRYTEVFDA